jgi:3-oxoacyl-(acyl-carrier-protein) synthase/acyl carrier protein/NAD(P)-dependent dehydrogenase (short-subunit alcohol dehydrogenase family)
VAVIGLGALFPGQPGLAGFWSMILEGQNAITEIPPDRFNPLDYFDPDPRAQDRMYCRKGAFLSPTPFDPLKFGVAPKDLESIDSTQLLGLIVADAALTDAGYPADQADHQRTAVILGVTGGLKMLGHMSARTAFPQVKRALRRAGANAALIEEVLGYYGEEFAPWTESSFPGLLGNVVSGRIANRLNLGGANMVVDAACASSLAAVGQALLELNSGRADLVLTGGMDTFTDPFMFTCFCKTPALSPSEEVRPYAENADGTILGEGLGALVLKRLPEALEDNDRIYAIIRSVGGSSDGRGTSIFAPSADGQLRAMKEAYAAAGFSPHSVELVEGHGTGTKAGDAAEIKALTELFNDADNKDDIHIHRALGSIKSQIGHAKAAAGAAGLIKAILSLYHKVLPPTIKATTPNKALPPHKVWEDPPIYLNPIARPWLANRDIPRRAAVSSFGFGGANYHCVLEEGPEPKPVGTIDQYLIPLSATNLESLMAALAQIAIAAANPWDLATTSRVWLSEFKASDPLRLVLTGSFGDVACALPSAKNFLEGLAAGQNLTPGSDFYFSNAPAKAAVNLIVSPYKSKPGRGRELALTFPVFLEAVEKSNIAPFNALMGLDLFPLQPELIPDGAAIPGLSPYYEGTAFGVAQAALWIYLGLNPTAVVTGDLLGLLMGAAITDALIFQDAFRAARERPFFDKFDAIPWLTPHDFSQPRWPLTYLDRVITTRKEFAAAFDQAIQQPDSNFPPLVAANAHNLVIGEAYKDDPKVSRLNDPLWTLSSLAAMVASLSVAGVPLRLENWPNIKTPPPVPNGYFVNLNGGHHFEAIKKPALKPKTALMAPLGNDSLTPDNPVLPVNQALPDNQALPVNAALNDLVAIQSQTLAALKELTLEIKKLTATGAPFNPPSGPAIGANLAANLGPETIAQSPAGPPAAPASSDGPSSNDGDVWPVIIDILARETGYPADSLTSSLDLEEDLGLDSIKRVELLALLAERFPALTPIEAQPRTLGDLAALCQGPIAQPLAASPTASLSEIAPSPNLAALNPTALVQTTLAQETGYPVDSLTPDLDLESDLGLDSIKRVEILATLADKLPGLDPASLSGAVTLGDLITELTKLPKAPAPKPAPVSLETQAPGLDQEPGLNPIATTGPDVLAIIAQETGYPVDLLEPKMDLEGDLGLDSIKKVEILSTLAENGPDLTPLEQGTLASAQTLGDWLDFFAAKFPSKPQVASPAKGSPKVTAPTDVTLAVKDSPLTAKSPTVKGNGKGNGHDHGQGLVNGRAILDAALNQSQLAWPSLFQVEPEILTPEPGPSPWPPGGLVRLVGSDRLSQTIETQLKKRGYKVERRPWSHDFAPWENSPADILFLVWPGPDRRAELITQALKALKASGPSLKAIAGLSFLGGTFGFPRPTFGLSHGNSISGALVGLLKCAAREWPEVFTRVLDLPLAIYEIPRSAWVTAILDHVAAPGPVELGLAALDRLTGLTLKPYSPAESPDPLLNPGDTVVVTGGGRGVTAAVVKEMAILYKPRLVILGRTPLGPPEPEWLAKLTTDKEIKAALHEAHKGGLTPKELGERTRLILSTRELKRNLAALEATGSTVEYIAGDFTQPQVLEEAARKTRARFGPIRGFIHGAGVLADHPILGKSHEDFARVYTTKTQIAASFLEAFQPEPLKLVVFFSSSTARFGRQGQSDYAAGNEVLNKTAWELSTLHPKARILAVNWGPWAGGMVSETLAGQFNAQGVGLIGLQEGAKTFVRLIRSPVGDPAEVVVLGQGTNLSALTAYARGTQ